MKLRSILFMAALLLFAAKATTAQMALPQDAEAKHFASTITQADLRKHLEVVAGDAMEGRETGTPGQKKAAAYIANHFKSLNLAGPTGDEASKGYYQPFPLERRSNGDIYVKVKGGRVDNLTDVVYFGSASITKEVKARAVFVGEGNPSDFEGINVEGKLVVMYSPGRGSYNAKVRMAKEKGAAYFMVVNTENQEAFNKLFARYKVFLARPSIGAPEPGNDNPTALFFAAPDLVGKMFGKDWAHLQGMMEQQKENDNNVFSRMKPAKLRLKAERKIEPMNSENVLGYMEGTDLKDEVIVITSHYDHLGMSSDGQVYNGANDDGSGTVAVLELAEAFAKAKAEGQGPRRSILFMTVSGEEKGLLGSEYYVENPIFPLSSTVTNLNVDMIGRIDEAHEEDPNFIYVIGADKLSQELHDLHENVNATYTNISLDYTYNDENDPNRYYYRSDHYNFAKNNIPIIFYFNGVHDDYHQTSDTIEKIQFDKVENITRLVFHTAWEIANRDGRLKLNSEE